MSIAGGVYYVLDGTKKYNEIFSTTEKYDAARTKVAKNYPDVDEREAALAVFEKGRYIRSAGILTILGQIFCLIGVFKMRNLNKEGFALYSIGELGVPIGTAMLLGFLPSLPSLLFGIVFVVLYGTRLGEMRLFQRNLA